MADNDLTTLPAVQDWLSTGNQAPSNSDSVLSRLITSVSGQIMAYLQRSSFLSQTYNDVVSGRGSAIYFLDEWPVTEIVSLSVDGIAVPASLNQGPGWVLSPWNGYPPGAPQQIRLLGGYTFARGDQNIAVSFQAGYLVSNEPGVIPSGAAPSILLAQPQGPMMRPESVTYASTGIALTRVASSPAAGQYAVATPTQQVPQGTLLFNTADASAAVLTSYSYVPSAVEAACVEWVAERFRYRSRMGQRSQSIGGQTSNSYDLSDIPAFVKLALNPYRQVLPTS